MSGSNFVMNPGGGVSPAKGIPNFIDQQLVQKPRDENYAIKHRKGATVLPEVGGSAQVGTGIGLPKRHG